MRKLLIVAAFLALLGNEAKAHQLNFTWTAPNMYNDGVTTLPLTAITNFLIYQTDLPVPGMPGTLLVTINGPFTAAAQTYTFNSTTITSGSHTFIIETTTSNGSVSAPSNILTLVIPNLAGAPISNFNGTAIN